MNQRSENWRELEKQWDVIIVGGGITGAGIFREAVALGLKTLLVEAQDYAWGTSSRSSKLVHGGLRYLKEGQVRMTWASVHERQQLLNDAPGLVEPLGFLVTSYKGDWPPRWINRIGVMLYDLMARQWRHKAYDPEELTWLAPGIQQNRLVGALAYQDAQTDDARLVLRLILDGIANGGMALNYARAKGLLRNGAGVSGVRLCDAISNQEKTVSARVVINATGAWADSLRQQVGAEPRIRPLRGSHLIFPTWRLPVAQAVSFIHPYDGRWIFVFPWENVVLVGTTDVDHGQQLDEEPRISPEEVAYLMAAITKQYPSFQLGLSDIMATFAGVRPVVGTGKADPSHESREHVVWQEEGLLTVTGGKLTTFRLIAQDALEAVADRLPDTPGVDKHVPLLAQVDVAPTIAARVDATQLRRLRGRHGAAASDLVVTALPEELETIPGTSYLWAELRWAAKAEQVIHLQDLLVRRLRLALLLPEGGVAHLPRIRAICQEELGWDERKWDAEEANYRELWRGYYSVPDNVPKWQETLREAQQAQIVRYSTRRRRAARGLLATFLAGVFVGAAVLWRRVRGTSGIGARIISRLPRQN